MDTLSMFDYKTRVFLLDCIIIIALLVVCIMNAKQGDPVILLKDMFFILSFFIILFVIWDIVLRLNRWLARAMELNTQYDVDMLSTIQDLFKFNLSSIIIIVISVLSTALIIKVCGWPLNYILGFSPFICIPCILLSWTLLRLTGFTTWDLYPTPFINSMKGLDYGTGMAYSYYYGYLRIILPSTGTATKGLIEKIENIEDNHNVTLACQKLLILIPSSSYIPPDLKQASENWMENAIELEDEERARAGIKRRTYRNNVYKIYPGGIKSGSRPLYIVAEGATPLLTFFEVQKHMHSEAIIYRKYNLEIVRAFYTKLKELLHNDPECKDLCELIYYDDINSDGTKVNVAKVILDRLTENKTLMGIERSQPKT